jgi:hypothetical protein
MSLWRVLTYQEEDLEISFDFAVADAAGPYFLAKQSAWTISPLGLSLEPAKDTGLLQMRQINESVGLRPISALSAALKHDFRRI